MEPNPNQDRINEVGGDIKKYSALEGVYGTEGGKLLVESYLADVVSTLDRMMVGYKTMTHIQLIAYCAELSEKMDVIRTLTRSRTNKDYATDNLKELLKS